MCKECNDGSLRVALSKLADEIFAYCVKQGFEPDKDRTFGEEMSLVHEEVSEAFKAWRKWGFEDATGPEEHHIGCAKVMFDIKEDCSCHIPPPSPEGVGSEFADILIRLLHYAKVHNIDLISEVRRKMAYNETRPYRHGGRKL